MGEPRLGKHRHTQALCVGFSATESSWPPVAAPTLDSLICVIMVLPQLITAQVDRSAAAATETGLFPWGSLAVLTRPLHPKQQLTLLTAPGFFHLVSGAAAAAYPTAGLLWVNRRVQTSRSPGISQVRPLCPAMLGALLSFWGFLACRGLPHSSLWSGA